MIFAGRAGHVEVAVRDDRYKLVARPIDAGLMDNWTSLKLAAWPNARRTSPLRGKQYRFALYDLVADLHETTDLSGRVPEVQAALVSYLVSHTQHGIHDFRKRQVADSEISDGMQEQLRALGYVE